MYTIDTCQLVVKTRRKNWKLDLDIFKIGNFAIFGKNDILGLRLRKD